MTRFDHSEVYRLFEFDARIVGFEATRREPFAPDIAVETGVDFPPAKKTENILTRLHLFCICSHTAVLKEKVDHPVPSKPLRLAPLATDRGAGRCGLPAGGGEYLS